MAIDYSAMAFPKSRPKALDKQDKDRAIETLDKAESAKARKRAKGRCEVRWIGPWSGETFRCAEKDTQTHHLKGGIGRRNKGDSILAINKLRVCDQCHSDISKHILRTLTAEHDASTVRYWRSR